MNNVLKAVGKKVIIDAFKPEDRPSGFILPNIKNHSEEKGTNYGTVISVGGDVKQIEVGDLVWYVEGTYWKNNKRINLDSFTHEGKEYICVEEHEIKMIQRE